MGGPQSPDEDRENFPYYDPKAELSFMKEAIAADIYIVGVCLGAQLLSVAYGAKYEHSPEPVSYTHLFWNGLFLSYFFVSKVSNHCNGSWYCG